MVNLPLKTIHIPTNNKNSIISPQNFRFTRRAGRALSMGVCSGHAFRVTADRFFAVRVRTGFSAVQVVHRCRNKPQQRRTGSQCDDDTEKLFHRKTS